MNPLNISNLKVSGLEQGQEQQLPGIPTTCNDTRPSSDEEPVKMLAQSGRRRTVEFENKVDVVPTAREAEPVVGDDTEAGYNAGNNTDDNADDSSDGGCSLRAESESDDDEDDEDNYSKMGHSNHTIRTSLEEYQQKYDDLIGAIIKLEEPWSVERLRDNLEIFGNSDSIDTTDITRRDLLTSRAESLKKANSSGTATLPATAEDRFISNFMSFSRAETFMRDGSLLIEWLDRSSFEGEIKEQYKAALTESNELMVQLTLLLEKIKKDYPNVQLVRKSVPSDCSFAPEGVKHDPEAEQCGRKDRLVMI